MSNNNKGFTITITNNETGETLVNYTDAKVIIGGIQIGDISHSIGFVHCSPFDVAYAISAAQKSIINQTEEHPEINFIAQMIAQIEAAGIDDDEDGGDSDDE